MGGQYRGLSGGGEFFPALIFILVGAAIALIFGFDLPTNHISAQSTRGDLQPHSGLLMHGRNN